MKKIVITLFTTLILLASCTANRGFVSTVTCADIQSMPQFEILTNISYIEQGNRLYYSDSLTTVAKELFDTALANDTILPITETLVINDSIVNDMVQYEIHELMRALSAKMRIKQLPIPPTIDSILCARNERFGLLVYNYGFTRSEKNYTRQMAKGVAKTIAIGILSMGTLIAMDVPYQYMTRSGMIVWDAENHKIAYVATAERESNPLDPETYQKQLKDLLKAYQKKK